MLNSIELIDFKNHVNTKIRLQRLTLLVGPNGAGKTGVLQGIILAHSLLCYSVEKALERSRCAEVSRRRGRGFRLSLAGVSGLVLDSGLDAEVPWSIELRVEEPDAVGKAGKVSFSLPGIPEWTHELDFQNSPPITDQLAEASTVLGRAVILHLDAGRLAKPSYLGSAVAYVMTDGYGLASTIAHLMTYERERFDVLEEALIELIPSVKRIRVRRIETKVPNTADQATPHRVIADELVLDMHSGNALPASALSEGTLILLGLLTFLTDPEPPQLLLIDDLDRSLHPQAQAQLIDLLRRTLDQHPYLQIVATSHSPYLVDELNDDEVWVLNLRDDGTAAAACLADHPDAERFRGVLRTGEFLTSVGEDWVISPTNSDKGDADAAGTDR
jgi:hypothetical protein